MPSAADIMDYRIGVVEAGLPTSRISACPVLYTSFGAAIMRAGSAPSIMGREHA